MYQIASWSFMYVKNAHSHSLKRQNGKGDTRECELVVKVAQKLTNVIFM